MHVRSALIGAGGMAVAVVAVVAGAGYSSSAMADATDRQEAVVTVVRADDGHDPVSCTFDDVDLPEAGFPASPDGAPLLRAEEVGPYAGATRVGGTSAAGGSGATDDVRGFVFSAEAPALDGDAGRPVTGQVRGAFGLGPGPGGGTFLGPDGQAKAVRAGTEKECAAIKADLQTNGGIPRLTRPGAADG